MKRSRFFCLSIVLILLVNMLVFRGCQSKHLGNKPNITDLVGVWQPTMETLGNMERRGKYKISIHQLILRADGTFTMTNMPDCVFSGWNNGWDDSHSKFKSANGRWHLINYSYKNQDIWDIQFEFATPGIGEMPSVPAPVLVARGSSYLLHFSFGDLDFGHAVEFSRKG